MILQASSGDAWRSLAALIILPFFSASSRSGMKPFMQASAGPPAWLGGAGGANEPGPPAIGAAPADGNGEAAGGAPMEARGAIPLTGGKAGSLAGAAVWPGRGAGNAPCANAEPTVAKSTASVSGTIKRWVIKAVSPARFNAREGPDPVRSFYDSCRPLTTRGIWQQRGAEPHLRPIFAPH